MKESNPVVTQAISAVSFIALIKAVIAVLKAFNVINFNEEQDTTIIILIDTGIPILVILFGAWWASRKVTPLAAPRDVDGATLSRPDNSLAIEESAKIESDHEKALKMNESMSKVDERRIKR